MKHFPIYKHAQYTPVGQSSAKQFTMSICGINSLQHSQVLDIIDPEKRGESVTKQAPVCLVSCGGLRQYLGVGVDDDKSLMGQRGKATHPLFLAYSTYCYMRVHDT